MKQNTVGLNMQRFFAAAVCASLIASSVVLGQQNDKQKREQSGTAAKMKLVPKTPVDRDIEQEDALSAPRSGVIARATVQQNRSGQVLRVEGEIPVQNAADARDAANKFLVANADKLGVAALVNSRDVETGLRVVGEVKSLTGTHLTYNQFYNNLPVFDEQMKISVDNKLRITNVTHDIMPVPESRDLETTPNNADAAVKAALKAVTGTVSPKSAPKAELGIVMQKQGDPAAVYSVTFATINPAGVWMVLVNAASLAVLSVRNIAQYERAGIENAAQTAPTTPAKIFVPNPVNSSGISAMLDNDNADYPQINGQYKIVALRDLDASNTLNGKYASTAPTSSFARAKAATSGYVFPRSDKRFDEVMAYHWVTEATHYVHDIGFTGILNRSMGIDVDGIEDDNSFYSPADKQLTFGSGGVHDAQDASIILHEFGHALLDAQVPGFGGHGTEAGAISEGFGDYFAATYFAGTSAKGSVWDVFVGTWDAVAYNPGAPAFLRRVDGTKGYADLDAEMEVHNNGEIWSSHLWEIRQKLGKAAADKLIIEAHFKLSPRATFRENAEAIIKTDGELNGGKNQAVLRQIFTKRGILGSTSGIVTTPTVTAAVMTNQKWTGKDGLEFVYNYQFLTADTANVSIYVSAKNETYTDKAAKYQRKGDAIEISIFGGTIVQTGTINGNQISGKSVVNSDAKSAGENAKQKTALKKNLSTANKSDSYNWTANRLGGTGGIGTTTPTVSVVVMTNQKWAGKTGGLNFTYQFLSGGKVSVIATVPSTGKTYTDDAATYQTTGNAIEISIFSGAFVQTGTVNGNQITGQSVFTTAKQGTGKAAKIQADLRKNLSKADKSDSYPWAASRSN